MKPGDWLGYSTDTSEADVLRLAAAMLDVPEERVEVRQTGGGWLARLSMQTGLPVQTGERREETND